MFLVVQKHLRFTENVSIAVDVNQLLYHIVCVLNMFDFDNVCFRENRTYFMLLIYSNVSNEIIFLWNPRKKDPGKKDHGKKNFFKNIQYIN